MDRKWIDEAFKMAMNSDSFYAQKESKVKPRKEKTNWWMGSPAMPITLKDFLQYVPDEEYIKIIRGSETILTRGLAAKYYIDIRELRPKRITVNRGYLEIEVEE